MANGPDLLEGEEKKSYGAVFLLTVALLFACSLWAIWQDSFSRHLWKKWKGDFYRLAIARFSDQLEAENGRLAEVPEYIELEAELEQVRETLAGRGEEGRELRVLEKQLDQAEILVMETDLDLRIVKGEIEEAWYRVEHATHGGESGEAEKAEVHRLEEERGLRQAAYDAAIAERDAIDRAIKSLRRREIEIEDSLRPYRKEIDAINLRLDSVSLDVFGRRIPRVPTVEQVVLPVFERNNFDQWVERVERCQNCHVAIDRAGFDDVENPLKTHPNRAYYLGSHPVKKFGCTPCHGGQGASINAVELAHGEVKFWEEPLLSVKDKVQASCLRCHLTAQGLEGAEVVARGEQLFRDVGCPGCHLVAGFEDLPKAGPSLKRIAAKTTPEWMVAWVENPREFRPRTRMPHFYLSRQESEAIAAYLLAGSVADADAWLDLNPAPRGVSPRDRSLVAEGKALSERLGCLGCHGFEPDQYASQVALGIDTAPNLARIAEKTNARWIYSWLKNPRGFSETARMPRLRLSDREAAAITAYLMTLEEQPPLAVDAELRARMASQAAIDEGERLVRRYGCFGCHTINGMESESRVSVELSGFAGKHLEELFFGDRLDIPNTWDDWTLNKILTPRTYATDRIVQNMPHFGLQHADARAMTVFLASRSTHRINPIYLPPQQQREKSLKAGRELMAYYNCYGCHSFDGHDGAIRKYYEDDIEAAPPILVGEGKKLQPEWFFDFLKRPMRLRPWLDVRMPTFDLDDDETSLIVDYFAALDGYRLGPVVVEGRAEANTAKIDRGEIPSELFDCSACHVMGGGRVPADVYAISRKTLTDAQAAAWIEEHLGIEPVSTQARADAVEALRGFLVDGAN